VSSVSKLQLILCAGATYYSVSNGRLASTTSYSTPGKFGQHFTVKLQESSVFQASLCLIALLCCEVTTNRKQPFHIGNSVFTQLLALFTALVMLRGGFVLFIFVNLLAEEAEKLK